MRKNGVMKRKIMKGYGKEGMIIRFKASCPSLLACRTLLVLSIVNVLRWSWRVVEGQNQGEA